MSIDNGVFITSSIPPTLGDLVGNEGMLWVDTTNKELYYATSIAWIQIGPGTGNLVSNYQQTTPINITQNSNYTYNATEWLSGIIIRNPNSNDVEDTMPSASSIIALIPSPVVGMTFNTEIYNISNKEVKKMTDGSGMNTISLSTTQMKIKKDDQRVFRNVITSISPDTISIYSYRNDMTG